MKHNHRFHLTALPPLSTDLEIRVLVSWGWMDRGHLLLTITKTSTQILSSKTPIGNYPNTTHKADPITVEIF
jgi:hypothetical protein